MGQSTDAYLFYGYCWNEYAADIGEDDNERIVDAWNDLKKGVESEIGVEWGRHCSGEYPMPFLCIPESKKTAYRGDREPVTSLAVGEGWDALLAAHMEAQGAPIPEGENRPGWWLVSYWG